MKKKPTDKITNGLKVFDGIMEGFRTGQFVTIKKVTFVKFNTKEKVIFQIK